MDTFISIIGLASFIYLFILGAKTLKAKITPRPPVYLPVPRTIAAQVQTRLCDKEYEGMPCRIFSSDENDFTLIYTPKPLSRESAEAIIRNEPDLMRHEICFHTTPDEAYYHTPLTIRDIDAKSPYGQYLHSDDGSYTMIFGFNTPR